MTVSSSTNKVSYSGNGSLTTFAYTFKIFDEDDLTVILRASDGTETTQTITTHYTVTGVGVASGGNVVFGSAPASGVTVVIIREQPLTQGLDLVPNDPFPAQSLEEALDKVVFMTQKHEEELSRAIKASRTNTLAGSEFTISASDRANKVFAFDSSGNVSITSELGTFKGNWSASTAYVQRDIVKDTSTNNIFIANTAHTSSGSQPLTTNTDSAKWDLLVDAASATTSATNAATSETNAATSATNAATSATNAATSETNAATSATNAATSATSAASSATSAAASYDSFDDRYLGAKSSDPSTDNDGDALVTGALYFNTTSGMKVYDGSSWDDVKPTSSEQTNIDTVAGISSNVTTVAGISSNVTTVAGISSDVTTVAADGTDIGTVAGISANVTTVAGIDSDVTTVAGISSNVTTVAGDATDIGTVATNISNVNTVAGNNTNITTVAGISSNVTTVAGISANVTTVAGDTTNIGTIATNLGGTDTIGTVAGSISNVNTVGGAIANVNTVATNISGVNSFAERYRVGSSDPTTSLDAGDLAFNTSDNGFKFYDGSSWQTVNVSGIGSLAEDTTPQLGGNLDVNSNDITGTGNVNITGSITASSTVSGSNIPSFLPESFVTATANGAISDGDVVFQNTDGTVEKFTAASVTGESLGSAVTIDEYYAVSVAFDSSNNKIVFAYRDGSTSQLKCKIGTISGTSVSFGSAVTITTNTPSTRVLTTFDTNANKAVIMWSDTADNNDIKGVVGTVSGTSISFGSITTAATGGGSSKVPFDITFDSSNNKVVCVYYDGNNSNYGTSVIGTVSGTSISFGTPVVFNSASTFELTCTFDSFNNKVVVAYKDNGGTADGEAVVGTVSGTSISYGSLVTFADYSATPSKNIGALRSVFDASQNKVVLFYDEALNGGFALVGTVSGTSITFGTETAYRGAGSDDLKNGQPSYDSTAEAVIIVYRDEDNNDYTTLAVGKVSGTSISFRTPVVVNTGAGATQQVSVYDSSNNKTFIAHSRSSTTDQAYVLTITSDPATDLDTYIGISNGAYSDTATATIQIVGSVDDAQSGLTIGTSYFVADDGSLSATNNGRKIGKAVSATELIIDTAMTGSEMNAYLGGLV